MFVRLIATVFSAPDASTAASRLAIASNALAAGRKSSPVSCPSRAAMRAGNSACVLIPVPTAVPPIGSSVRLIEQRCRRATPCSTWLA